MDDKRIVELFFERDEQALTETKEKYSRYLHRVAHNILQNQQDAEECVNDTWLRAWNAIPPERPAALGAWLSAVTRRLALSRYDYKTAAKRYGGIQTSLDELAECVPDGSITLADDVAMGLIINSFLESLPTRTRMVFMRKYWYMDSVEGIAAAMGMSVSAVKVILYRTRKKFRAWLDKEGIVV
jgi:RNA polymerase sigma-70 factor (ECF subfamily)